MIKLDLIHKVDGKLDLAVKISTIAIRKCFLKVSPSFSWVVSVHIISQKNVKTHIISGFLGAGKTTLLQQLLKQKPEGET